MEQMCGLISNINPSSLCTEDTPRAQQVLLPATALSASPAVWQHRLFQISKVSAPTHCQPVPNMQLKGSGLAAGLFLQVRI